MKQNFLNYHNLGYKRTVAVRASPADSQRLAATQLWCRPAQIPESGVNEPAPAEPAGQSGHPAAGVQARRDTTQVQTSFFFWIFTIFLYLLLPFPPHDFQP